MKEDRQFDGRLGFVQYSLQALQNNTDALVVDSPRVNPGHIWYLKRFSVLVPNFGFSSGSIAYLSGLYLCSPGVQPIPSNGTALITAAQFQQGTTHKLDTTLDRVASALANRTAYQVSFGKPVIVPSGWFLRAVANSNGAIPLNALILATYQVEDIPTC